MYGHSANPGYKPGNHWNECQVCGFDIRASESYRRWDNAIVCKECFETRHPQDFVYATPDHIRAQGLVTGQTADINIAVGYGLKFNLDVNSQYLGLI